MTSPVFRPPTRLHALAIALVVLSWVLAIVFYDRMPDPVPTHWNFSGQPDGFMPKPFGAFMSPIAITVAWLLLSFGQSRSAGAGRSGAVQVALLAAMLALTNLHLVSLR
jgi:uncharacterized membrane protein